MLDSRQKRAAVVGTARAWYRNPHPSSMNAAERASVGQVYPVAIFTHPAPVFTGTIDNISELYSTGSYMYDFTTYFTYATSYALSPDLTIFSYGRQSEGVAVAGRAVAGKAIAGKTGWLFLSGILTIDTDWLGIFGPFTITGINSVGQTDSNTFTITIAVSAHAPSGNKRTILSSGKNRSLSSKNTTRTISFINKNRK